MQEKRQIKLKRILGRSYDQRQQKLNLCSLFIHWSDVLMVADCIIKSLRVDNCFINDHNIDKLLEFDFLELIQLNLNKNSITCLGVEKLMMKKWEKLQSIELSNLQIVKLRQKLNRVWVVNHPEKLKRPVESVKAKIMLSSGINTGIIKLQHYKFKIAHSLQFLYYSYGNPIGNKGIKLLVKSQLNNLQILSIGQCKISSEGFKDITKSTWPQLKQLQLIFSRDQNTNVIGVDGWQILYQNNWNKLKQVQIPQFQSICWMNSVLIPSKTPIINSFFIEIQNIYLDATIRDILSTKRHLLIQL